MKMWSLNKSHICSYYLIKYEDLATDTEKELRKLYEFAGIPFSKEVKSHIQKLTNGSSNSNGFFGLVRNQKFDINHWRSQLNERDVQEIEKYCEQFMKAMNYTVLRE